MFTIEKIEYRPAKKGEWFWNRINSRVQKAIGGFDESAIVLIGYEPEKFVPEENEDYYYADVACEDLYDDSYFNYDDDTDNFRLEHGLCYPYTEEGRAQAIEHAKRMLEV